MFLLCIISVFCGQCCLFPLACAQNKIVCSERKRRATSSSPRLFDPQPSQLFSITFKLLFTRSQRIDLNVQLPPPRFFCLSLKIHSSIIYLSAKQVFKASVIASLYMCGLCVYDH